MYWRRKEFKVNSLSQKKIIKILISHWLIKEIILKPGRVDKECNLLRKISEFLLRFSLVFSPNKISSWKQGHEAFL